MHAVHSNCCGAGQLIIKDRRSIYAWFEEFKRQCKPIRGMQKAFGTLTSPSPGRCSDTSWCTEKLHFRGPRFQSRPCTTAEARLEKGKCYTGVCHYTGTLLLTMAPYVALSEVPSAE